MSLSKSQKARLYGENTHLESQKSVSGSSSRSLQTTGKRGKNGRPGIQSMAAEPEKASSYMFAGVSFTVAILLFIYYYFWVLPELSNLAGTAIPELMFWFDNDHIFAVQQGLGVDNIVQYQFVHRSSGLILPVLITAAWIGMISASRYPPVTSRLMKIVPVFYAVIFVAGGFALDLVIANPNGPVGIAALLISIRWLLLAACLLQLFAMLIRLVRAKVIAFSRGELPGQ